MATKLKVGDKVIVTSYGRYVKQTGLTGKVGVILEVDNDGEPNPHKVQFTNDMEYLDEQEVVLYTELSKALYS